MKISEEFERFKELDKRGFIWSSDGQGMADLFNLCKILMEDIEKLQKTLTDLDWFIKHVAGKGDKSREFAFSADREIAGKLLKRYKGILAETNPEREIV